MEGEQGGGGRKKQMLEEGTCIPQLLSLARLDFLHSYCVQHFGSSSGAPPAPSSATEVGNIHQGGR